MHLSWNEYKKTIEGFLAKIYGRCRLLEDYELESLTDEKMNITSKYIYNFYNEDKSYVKYICDSLEGEMLKWQKKYYNVRDHKKYKRCKECGKLIEKTGKNTQYCNECKDVKRKETKRNWWNKHR
jgi:formamidopyrimidine-DNA glycosylase